MGCSPWGCKELAMTERLTYIHQHLSVEVLTPSTQSVAVFGDGTFKEVIKKK